MENDTFTFEDQTIQLKSLEKVDSSFKVQSYKKKVKLMEKEDISQKSIEEVLEDFFSKSLDIISYSTKKSISEIVYCNKDRIIIVESSEAREIIWKRKKLVERYGWFFFVTKKYVSKEEKKQKKKKKSNSKETLISEERFKANGFEIDLLEKENMRNLYHTKEYFHYNQIMKSNNIPQKPIQHVLKDFFLNDRSVPLKEKKSIRRIIYYKDERVIVVKSLIGDKMYENLETLVRRYGWYFYITGVPVGKSNISTAIDKIEHRFDISYFENVALTEHLESSDDVRLLLYPIASRPNHNCLVLGIGELNILLDCGIEDESLSDIDEYLENINELIIKDKTKKIVLSQKGENKNESNQDTQEDNSEQEQTSNSQAEQEAHEEDSEKNNEVPLNKEDFEPKIDAVFLSHSHYDHVSGLLCFIKNHPDVPVLCSRITLDLYLLRDSDFLDQEDKSTIEQEDYRNVVKNVIYVENGDKIEFKDSGCYLAFFHAGHMPGALMLMAKAKGYRFLYTGDYTYYDITPFAGTQRFLEQISRPLDFLLIDGSSAYEQFGDPSQHFHSLILFLEQKAEYGDNSLIGADPSSLAISFMLKFWRYFRKKQLRQNYKKRPNIYVDMMVRKNIQVINHRYKYIYGPISRLIRDKANPFNSIKFRWFDHDNLDFLRKKNNVIISHPPDLSYGIIKRIFSSIAPSPHNLIFLAGGIHEEPGYSLVNPPDEKKNKTQMVEFSETWRVPSRALLVNTFAPRIKIKLHGDQKQLKEMIKVLQPKRVCFFHESPRKLYKVAEDILSLGVEKVSTPREKGLMILN